MQTTQNLPTLPALIEFVTDKLASGCHYADFQLATRATEAGFGVIGTLDMRDLLDALVDDGLLFTDLRGDYGLTR